MLYFIFGLIFALFDFSIALGDLVLGILPGFVGGLLMVKGCGLYRGASSHFALGEKLAWAYAAVSFVQYSVAMFNMQFLLLGFDVLQFGMILASYVMLLILCFQISAGLLDMERKSRVKIQAGRVRTVWIILTVLDALVALCYILYGYFGDWGGDLTLAAYVVSIIFIVFVSTAFKDYNRKVGKNELTK